MFAMHFVFIYNVDTNLTKKGAKMEKNKTMVVRIDADLLATFHKIARANNRTGSQLVRDWVIEYVKKNRQTEMKF